MHEIARLAVETDVPLSHLVRAFYGPDGPLAANGLQVRPSQAEMSIDIAEAMERGGKDGKLGVGWTLHQAPTGTGKGASYLVPGVLAALRAEAKVLASEKPDEAWPRLVVSTANIALQDQLLRKDVPMIAKILGVEIRATIQKSVSNYLCRKSMHDLDSQDPAVERLLAWSDVTRTGDREELEWDAGPAWGQVSRSSDDCLARSCPHYATSAEEPCFWRSAQRGREKAHVVITNHAMLSRVQATNAVLLAIDEAHVLESALRSAGSFTVRRDPGRSVANLAAEFVDADAVIQRIERPAQAVYQEAVRYAFPDGAKPGASVRLRPRWAPDALVEDVLADLDAANAMAERAAVAAGATSSSYGWRGASGNEESGRAARAANAVGRLLERMRVVLSGGEANDEGIEHVVYVEASSSRRGDRPFLDINVAPIDVAGQFAKLVRDYPRVAMTSATLHDDRAFNASLGIASEGQDGGIPDPFCVRKRLPSPFDLPSQGLLVIPTGPPPTQHGWDVWARDVVVAAVKGAQGRTLVLSSTWKQAADYAAALREADLPWPILVQGEAGRSVLRQRFRDEIHSVLVGTRSFFEGLDVSGESCSCVVIDRIPFARPDDLVEDAVATAISQRAHGSPYLLRTVPEAAMVLAQGAGRLIRSATDRGALVILDNRITQSGAGWQRLMAALPPFRRSGTVHDVAAFLSGGPLRGVVEAPKRRRMVLADWEE